LLPEVVNWATHAPGLSHVAKWAAGVSAHRSIPRFAPQTFTSWFSRHVSEGGARVVLFPDTFTNRFNPEIGAAAVAVLEAAGCRVEVPQQFLCCGRPLYDFGYIDRA